MTNLTSSPQERSLCPSATPLSIISTQDSQLDMDFQHVTLVQEEIVQKDSRMVLKLKLKETAGIDIVDQRIKQWILSKKTFMKLDSSTPLSNDTSLPTLYRALRKKLPSLSANFWQKLCKISMDFPNHKKIYKENSIKVSSLLNTIKAYFQTTWIKRDQQVSIHQATLISLRIHLMGDL